MSQRNSALEVIERSGLSFAGFHLEADGTLLRGEATVHLPPKELAALRVLLDHAGRIVTPLQLRQALWGEVHVTADSVPKCVSSLRARLEPEDCIQTVYKRGYRFTAEVRAHGAGPGGLLPRLAILPFSADFGVPGHLGAAIAEEAMMRLSGKNPGLVSVLAQNSVFTLADRGMTALEVGRTLNADLVLAGTLRALPTHFRMRAEMIRVEDGTQVWVEDVLVDRSRTAGLETELVDRLAVRLSAGTIQHRPLPLEPPAPLRVPETASEKIAPLPSPRTGKVLSISAVADPKQEDGQARREAWDIFQRAHYEWQTLQRHRMQDGLQHLLRATELDPSLTSARVDLANLCVAQCFYGYMAPAVAADIVRRAAEAVGDVALQAAGMLPAMGWIDFHFDRNLPAALSAFAHSSHLPHAPWTTRVRSLIALSRHRFDEAIELLRSAIRLDPYAPWLHARLAWSLHLAGEAAASVEEIQRTLAQFPDHESTILYGAGILAYNGEAARACELAQKLAERLPYFDLATAMHAYALACAGRGDEARSILERLEWLGRERFLLRAFTPAVYVALGEYDNAITEMQASDEIRCPWFFQLLADPRHKPLRDRPEFIQMRSMLANMEAEAAHSMVTAS